MSTRKNRAHGPALRPKSNDLATDAVDRATKLGPETYTTDANLTGKESTGLSSTKPNSTTLPQQSPTQRRSALRYLIATAAIGVPATLNLPARWRQPIVNSVILPAHAQTSCPIPPPGRSSRRDHDECLVVTLSGALEDATAELRTPSGTVIPVLSLATLQIGGCCNAIGHTVTATSVVVNLAAPEPSVSLPAGSSTVTSTGNFSINVATPVSPLLAITDIADVTVELNCDNEVSISLVISGTQISSVSGGTSPPPIVCRI